MTPIPLPDPRHRPRASDPSTWRRWDADEQAFRALRAASDRGMFEDAEAPEVQEAAAVLRRRLEVAMPLGLHPACAIEESHDLRVHPRTGRVTCVREQPLKWRAGDILRRGSFPGSE